MYLCVILGRTVYLAILFMTQGGSTPLMAASIEGHVDIVRMFIEAKSQINTQDQVCYNIIFLPPENTLHFIVTLSGTVAAVLGELTVFLSTEWLDCPSPGSSGRTS